jgi:hypothetical protein
MAMLCARVDTDTIRLMGRWRSDEMIRYLHLQALPHLSRVAQAMVDHGAFTYQPGQLAPPEARPLLP